MIYWGEATDENGPINVRVEIAEEKKASLALKGISEPHLFAMEDKGGHPAQFDSRKCYPLVELNEREAVISEGGCRFHVVGLIPVKEPPEEITP